MSPNSIVLVRLQVTIDPTRRPPSPPPPALKPICKCPKCGQSANSMYLKKVNEKFVIACGGYPDCRFSIWLPTDIRDPVVTDLPCPRCGPHTMKISLTFRSMSSMALLNSANMDGLKYQSCLLCDQSLREMLEMNDMTPTRVNGTLPPVSRPVAAVQPTSVRPETNNRRTDVGAQSRVPNAPARPVAPPPNNRQPPANNRPPPNNPNPGNSMPRQPNRRAGNADDDNVKCTKCGQPGQK